MNTIKDSLSATIWVGYYKEGDDLQGFAKRGRSASDSLEEWAALLEAGATSIRQVAKILKGKKVAVGGGAHVASIYNLDEETLAKLEKTGCVTRDEFAE